MRNATKLIALGWLLSAAMTGCEVPDPQPGAALYEKMPALPALPTVDWDPWSNTDGIEQLQYDPQHNLWLNIYKARLPQGVTAPKGIAFYVHGGAFTIGTRTDIHDVARYMWSQGWTLVSIDYRLSGRWLGQPVNPFPAAIHDAKRALRWIKNRYGTESSGLPIVAVGHSAGGNLVTLMATSALQPGETPQPGQLNLDANPKDPLRQISATVDGALAVAGATDLEPSLTAPPPPNLPDFAQPWLHTALTDYLGCPVRGDVSTCDLNVLRASSANSYVNAGDAPIYAAFHELDPGGSPTLGCRLGLQYAQVGQVVWYWMDIVLAPGPLASTLEPIATWFGPFEDLVTGAVGLEHHFALGLNTGAVDTWLTMIVAGNLPKTPPEGQSIQLVQRCVPS